MIADYRRTARLGGDKEWKQRLRNLIPMKGAQELPQLADNA